MESLGATCHIYTDTVTCSKDSISCDIRNNGLAQCAKFYSNRMEFCAMDMVGYVDCGIEF